MRFQIYNIFECFRMENAKFAKHLTAFRPEGAMLF